MNTDNSNKKKAYFHLPGLFEFYDLYRLFLPLYRQHKEYFYDWCEIGSIYGSPADCIWGGGRVEEGYQSFDKVLSLLKEYNIPVRLTLSNSLLTEEHLSDKKCNELCQKLSSDKKGNGVIIHSELLLDYLKEKYPALDYISSTTKVLTAFEDLLTEINNPDYKYVVPDFRHNKSFDRLGDLSDIQKDKIEFLCNECCFEGCQDRKACYEEVSRKNLGIAGKEHICRAPEGKGGYRFTKAMNNPFFISVNEIQEKYMPMGFSNFKIEGRGLGSALVFEMLLYYLVKNEYQIYAREAVYLDNMLDLF